MLGIAYPVPPALGEPWGFLGVLGESCGRFWGVLGRLGAPLGAPGPPRDAKAEKYQKNVVDLAQLGAILGPCWGHVGAIL